VYSCHDGLVDRVENSTPQETTHTVVLHVCKIQIRRSHNGIAYDVEDYITFQTANITFQTAKTVAWIVWSAPRVKKNLEKVLHLLKFLKNILLQLSSSPSSSSSPSFSCFSWQAKHNGPSSSKHSAQIELTQSSPLHDRVVTQDSRPQ